MLNSLFKLTATSKAMIGSLVILNFAGFASYTCLSSGASVAPSPQRNLQHSALTSHRLGAASVLEKPNYPSMAVPSPASRKLQAKFYAPPAHKTAKHPVHHTKKKASHRIVTHTTHTTSRGTSLKSVSHASTNTNLYWLSHIIHAEAANEPMKAQVAVGDVIMNRVHSSRYPNTVKGVIFQISYGHYQFTPVLNGYIYSTPDSASMDAAREVLRGINYVPSAFVYYTPSKTPATSWVRKQPVITTIADFVFAK